MPIKPRPHLAWIVRFVPLSLVLIACALLLILPQTRPGFIEGVKRQWEGEKIWEPITSIPERDCPIGPSGCTQVSVLAGIPEARAVVERHVPGFWETPRLMTRGHDLQYELRSRGVPIVAQMQIEAELTPVRDAVMRRREPVPVGATAAGRKP